MLCQNDNKKTAQKPLTPPFSVFTPYIYNIVTQNR